MFSFKVKFWGNNSGIFLPKRRLVLLWATLATSSSQAMTRSRWKKIVTSFYRSLLFFWHHSENWVFLKTVFLHFQCIKWAPTLQWCKTLAWKNLSPVQSRRNLLKYLVGVEMASDWFTRIYRSILAEELTSKNRDMACKLGCGLFLSPQSSSIRETCKVIRVGSHWLEKCHN